MVTIPRLLVFVPDPVVRDEDPRAGFGSIAQTLRQAQVGVRPSEGVPGRPPGPPAELCASGAHEPALADMKAFGVDRLVTTAGGSSKFKELIDFWDIKKQVTGASAASHSCRSGAAGAVAPHAA